MSSSASTTKSSSASARVFKHPKGNILALLAAQAAPPPAKASAQSIDEENLLSQLALHAAPFPMASSTAPPVGQGLHKSDFSSLHPNVPASLLRIYEKNFLSDNPNFSGEAAPHPSNLIRPPPTPTYYWVVTAGEKIGICHFPMEIDLSRIFSLPSFSVTRFENWDDAVKFYNNFFKARHLGLAKLTELGDEDEPILVDSNAPTPVQPKKKARFVFSKPTAPACSIGAKTRLRKNPPSTSQAAAIDVPSDTEDTDAKDTNATNSKPRVIVYDDDNSSDFSPQSYRQASSNKLATPIRSRKRTAQEQEALEYSILAERGSPVPKLSRPKKKSRAASEPAPSNLPAGDSDDLFLPDEDRASQPLLPLVFQGPPPSQASTSSRPAVSRNRRNAIVDDNDNENENEGLDNYNPELPAYPLHSSKGKGKAKEVF